MKLTMKTLLRIATLKILSKLEYRAVAMFFFFC